MNTVGGSPRVGREPETQRSPPVSDDTNLSYASITWYEYAYYISLIYLII